MVQSTSQTRTLLLPEYTGQTVGSVWPISWPSKTAADVAIDFSLDVTGWLEEIQDTIATVAATWEPNLPTDTFALTQIFSVDGVITVLASHGTPWQTYAVTVMATSTALGQTLSRTVQLPVEALYSRAPDATTFGQVSGVAL